MFVTITIPRYINLTAADIDRAQASELSVVQGIGSLFISGDLDVAANFARRFENATEQEN